MNTTKNPFRSENNQINMSMYYRSVADVGGNDFYVQKFISSYSYAEQRAFAVSSPLIYGVVPGWNRSTCNRAGDSGAPVFYYITLQIANIFYADKIPCVNCRSAQVQWIFSECLPCSCYCITFRLSAPHQSPHETLNSTPLKKSSTKPQIEI
jgi:hypothetical protein